MSLCLSQGLKLLSIRIWACMWLRLSVRWCWCLARLFIILINMLFSMILDSRRRCWLYSLIYSLLSLWFSICFGLRIICIWPLASTMSNSKPWSRKALKSLPCCNCSSKYPTQRTCTPSSNTISSHGASWCTCSAAWWAASTRLNGSRCYSST